jgi:hypothetical protein
MGAVYALERVARDSPKDPWTIMEILCTLIREKYPRPDIYSSPDAEGGDTMESGYTSTAAIPDRIVATKIEPDES